MIFSTNYNIDFLFDFELGSLGRKCNFMPIRHTHVLIEALEVRLDVMIMSFLVESHLQNFPMLSFSTLFMV